MDIILATASPRRHQLFNQMGISYQIKPSNIEEKEDLSLSPGDIAKSLAQQKGEVVAQKSNRTIVISADTIVVFDEKVLGKPQSETDAVQMLTMLSGNTHSVYSGVFVAKVDEYGVIADSISFSERTNVTFSTLNDSEIKRYVQTGSPLDKAGAYGIQDDLGALFVERIEGDYYNVVGFPINAFYQRLKNKKPDIFKHIFK
ncbi:MAG: Maf family protein [Balneolaceae bacterium]